MVEKQVLITGAGGFIGSHLTEHLVQKGFRVKALVHYRGSGDRGWLEHVSKDTLSHCEIISGDIRDAEQMRRMAEDCSHICHLAALIGIPYSYCSPRSYLDTNVTGTLNILEAARSSGAHVLQTSTSEVYGTAQYVPMGEDHPLQAQSPYAASKIGGDMLALSYARSFDMPVTVIRPFNTFGPRQSTRAVIPTIISQLLLPSEVLFLGALSPTRDFNYVENTVSAYHHVMQTPHKMTQGEVFNFGTGAEISIENLAKKMMKMMGVEKKIVTETERHRPENSEVNRLFSDPQKANRVLNWYPPVSLENGLEQTITWMKKAENMYRGYAQ